MQNVWLNENLLGYATLHAETNGFDFTLNAIKRNFKNIQLKNRMKRRNLIKKHLLQNAFAVKSMRKKQKKIHDFLSTLDACDWLSSNCSDWINEKPQKKTSENVNILGEKIGFSISLSTQLNLKRIKSQIQYKTHKKIRLDCKVRVFQLNAGTCMTEI